MKHIIGIILKLLPDKDRFELEMNNNKIELSVYRFGFNDYMKFKNYCLNNGLSLLCEAIIIDDFKTKLLITITEKLSDSKSVPDDFFDIVIHTVD
jgi:hypothetical protein